MCEVGWLCQVVETSTTTQDWEEEFGGGGPSGNDNPRSIWTIVLHELEWAEDQILKLEEQQDKDEERKEVELG